MQTLSIARSRLTSRLGWTRHSYYLLSAFVATLFVIGVVWWPLVEEQLAWIDWSRPLWLQMDWLLLGVFMVMSLLIMALRSLHSDGMITGEVYSELRAEIDAELTGE